MIENRLAGYSYGSDSNSVELAVSTSDVTATPSGVSLITLSDRGQAAMIEQTKGKPPVTIKADDASASAATTRNTVSRHVVVAVAPTAFLAPGDRVDAIRVTLEVAEPAAPKWQITSWTQASNGQTVIDLGKVTDTSTSKATVSAGFDVAKALPSLTVGGENDQTTERDVEIKDTTDFDAAVDNVGQAWLYETAGWRQSLAHNLSMDVVLAAPADEMRSKQVVSVAKLSIDDPKHKGSTILAPAASVRLTETSVYSPIDYEAAPVCGWATLTYRIRHVSNGAYTTFSESDDKVVFETGTTGTGFLFSPPPYRPGYVIKAGSDTLSYETAHGPPHPMIFAAVGDATAFRDWLNQIAPAKGRLANATIGFDVGGTIRPLTAAKIPSLNPQLENTSWADDNDWGHACEHTTKASAATPATPRPAPAPPIPRG